MSYQAGDTYPATATIRDEDGVLTDPPTLALKVRNNAGTVTTYDYPDNPIVRDGVGLYHADVLLSAAGMWVISWQITDEEQVEGVQIAVSPAPTAGITFATLDQLAVRLGKTGASELTAEEAAQGRMLLELVTGLITHAVDQTTAWSAALTPVPATLQSVCLEVAIRALRSTTVNPSGFESETETLGAYSHTVRYGSSDDGGGESSGGGLALTAAEERRVRRAVLGSSVASLTVETIFDSTFDAQLLA